MYFFLCLKPTTFTSSFFQNGLNGVKSYQKVLLLLSRTSSVRRLFSNGQINSSGVYKPSPQKWDNFSLQGCLILLPDFIRTEEVSKLSNFKCSMWFSGLVSSDRTLGHLWQAWLTPLFFPICPGACVHPYNSLTISRGMGSEWWMGQSHSETGKKDGMIPFGSSPQFNQLKPTLKPEQGS